MLLTDRQTDRQRQRESVTKTEDKSFWECWLSVDHLDSCQEAYAIQVELSTAALPLLLEGPVPTAGAELTRLYSHVFVGAS